MAEQLKMEVGKIYHLQYGGNEIVGRFKEEDTTRYIFYDLLQYWNGYETFRSAPATYSVKAGLESIRRASKSEIHNLVKHEIEFGCI